MYLLLMLVHFWQNVRMHFLLINRADLINVIVNNSGIVVSFLRTYCMLNLLSFSKTDINENECCNV